MSVQDVTSLGALGNGLADDRPKVAAALKAIPAVSFALRRDLRARSVRFLPSAAVGSLALVAWVAGCRQPAPLGQPQSADVFQAPDAPVPPDDTPSHADDRSPTGGSIIGDTAVVAPNDTVSETTPADGTAEVGDVADPLEDSLVDTDADTSDPDKDYGILDADPPDLMENVADSAEMEDTNTTAVDVAADLLLEEAISSEGDVVIEDAELVEDEGPDADIPLDDVGTLDAEDSGDQTTDAASPCVPEECDDEDSCTADACNPAVGCTHTPANDCCLASIGATCPVELGFECVSTAGKYFCENTASGEVYVPPGIFWQGCNAAKEPGVCYTKDENPQHEVYISAIAVTRTEVTVDDYLSCVQSGWCTGPDLEWAALYPEDSTWPDESAYPINFVTWYHAVEYCEWPDKAAGAQRLCTEAEWEKTARGSCFVNGCFDDDGACCTAAMRSFPWGEELPTCDLAIMKPTWEQGIFDDLGCGTGHVWPVGSKPLGMGPYGTFDMSGNVSEWVQDGRPDYCDYAIFADGLAVDPECDIPTGSKGVRGGGHQHAIYTFNYGLGPKKNASSLRATHRGFLGGGESGDATGIRCCRYLPVGP